VRSFRISDLSNKRGVISPGDTAHPLEIAHLLAALVHRKSTVNTQQTHTYTCVHDIDKDEELRGEGLRTARNS